MTDRRRRRRRRKNGCAFALIAVVILCAGAAAGIPWAVETFGGEVTEAFHENVEKAVHVLETETAAEPEWRQRRQRNRKRPFRRLKCPEDSTISSWMKKSG